MKGGNEIMEEEKTEEKIEAPSEAEEAIVEKARIENDRKEALEKIEAERLSREEKLMDRKEALAKLGGTSPAGANNMTAKEETPKEYADKVMKNEIKGQ